MKLQPNLLPVLALATATFSTIPGAAMADDERFNQFSSRAPVVQDSTRPYQHQSTASYAGARLDGFNDRTSHVGDSERPYQRPLVTGASGNQAVAREILTNPFKERTTYILDSARAYQQRTATAQR